MGDQLDPDQMRTICGRRARAATGTDRQDDGLLQRESHLVDHMQVKVGPRVVIARHGCGRPGLKQMVEDQALVVVVLAIDPNMCVERNGRNAHEQEHRGQHAHCESTGWSHRPHGKQGAQSSHDPRSMPKQPPHLKYKIPPRCT